MRLLLVVLCALVLAPAAGARPNLPEIGRSAHFALSAGPGALGAATAATVLGRAESSYERELALGFARPLDDGDGHIDLYVQALTDKAGVTVPDPGPGPLVSGSIELDPAHGGLKDAAIAHELFHLIQFATITTPKPTVVVESTAEWVVGRLGIYTGPPTGVAQAPFDCEPGCDFHSARASPYTQWTFFKQLSDRYGDRVIEDILRLDTSGIPAGPGRTLAIVDRVLARYGTTAVDAYVAWAGSLYPSGPQTATFHLFPTHPSDSVTTSLPPWSFASVPLTLARVEHCGPATLTIALAGGGPDLRPVLRVGTASRPLGRTGGTVVVDGCAFYEELTLVVPAPSGAAALTISASWAEAPAAKLWEPSPQPTFAVAVQPRATGSAAVSIRVTAALAGTVTTGGYGTFPVQAGTTTLQLRVPPGAQTLSIGFVSGGASIALWTKSIGTRPH
jgi:hypothetical protein